ncbi:inverse autotransporter beta domain-containing protein, partial [Escherichia coli]|nr:hypothetical protein [Escherichia coli]EKE5205507.1 inverse autotransporter beta domain-containing protein [Escherichia coli]EKH9325377.1 inverse autotransporter beta domain-containing protein [Escherichia coli]
LQVDKNFSLKNSQLELLFPVFEDDERLFFSQGGISYIDDKFISNIGIGYRAFYDNWMLGGNSFIDYDLRKEHSRLGLGIEYWQDNLKLGANSYLRLSNWRNSSNIVDYEERPANGLDLNIKSWLPSYPQIGGDIKYEKYYGDDVALFGENHRQRNPHSTTLGISYTPFPLMSFKAEHKMGSNNINDSRIGFEINYQIHTPWESQINPVLIPAMRKLSGQRYDLVERNNNIILDYRKKEIIKIDGVDVISGFSGEKKRLDIRVNSKYPVDRIDWLANTFIANGGKIINEGLHNYSIILPDYRNQENNSYTIDLSAIDIKGHTSNRKTIKIDVLYMDIDPTISSLDPKNISLPADGQSQKKLTLKIKNRNGLFEDINPDDINVLKTSEENFDVSSKITRFSRQEAGIYTATLTAGTKSERFTITPMIYNIKLPPSTVTISKDRQVFLSLSPSVITSGVDSATLRVTIKNSAGNIYDGFQDKIKLQYDTDLIATNTAFREIAGGVYETFIQAKKAGTTTITVLIDDNPVPDSKLLTVKADNNSATVKGSISANPGVALVGQYTTYKATLVDKNDNIIDAGTTVIWSADTGTVLNTNVVTTDKAGSVSVQATRSQPGIAKVELLLPSGGKVTAPDVIFNNEDFDEDKSELKLYPETINAGKDFANLELVLKDKKGNYLSGQLVHGFSNNTSVIVSDAREDINKPGHYKMTVTGSKSGIALLSVSVNNKTLPLTKKLVVNGDMDSWEIAEIRTNKNNVIAGDKDGVTYSTLVKDKHGNILPGVIVSWQLNGNSESFAPVSRTNAEGIATTTVRSNTAGELKMRAYLDEANYKDAANVTVIAGDIDSKNSDFSLSKYNIGADGIETSTLTLILKDKYGNSIPGKIVTVNAKTKTGQLSLDNNPMKEVGDGIYISNAKSSYQGRFELTLDINGNKFSRSQVLTVGTINTNLSFDNKTINETYKGRAVLIQQVIGLPESNHPPVTWATSDPLVAEIDSRTGYITMKKAGMVTITASMPGNDKYSPGIASYNLIISKANPQISSDGIINAVWGDKSGKIISVSFNNEDVASNIKPPVSFTSKDPSVVSIDNTGKIKMVKPGSTLIEVRSEETEQFLQSSAIVTYVLDKGRRNITFKNSDVKMTVDEKFSLQTPELNNITTSSKIWRSSNPKVIEINQDGSLPSNKETPNDAGYSEISLIIPSDEYYHEERSSYNLHVYGQPAINIGKISYVGNAQVQNNGRWTPVYADDVITINWSVET